MQEKQRSLSLALLQLLVPLHSSKRFTHSHSRQHCKLLPQGKTVHVCLPGGLQAMQRTRKPGKKYKQVYKSHRRVWVNVQHSFDVHNFFSYCLFKKIFCSCIKHRLNCFNFELGLFVFVKVLTKFVKIFIDAAIWTTDTAF